MQAQSITQSQPIIPITMDYNNYISGHYGYRHHGFRHHGYEHHDYGHHRY